MSKVAGIQTIWRNFTAAGSGSRPKSERRQGRIAITKLDSHRALCSSSPAARSFDDCPNHLSHRFCHVKTSRGRAENQLDLAAGIFLRCRPKAWTLKASDQSQKHAVRYEAAKSSDHPVDPIWDDDALSCLESAPPCGRSLASTCAGEDLE